MTRDVEDFEQSEPIPMLKQGHFIDLVCGDCHPAICAPALARTGNFWASLRFLLLFLSIGFRLSFYFVEIGLTPFYE